MTAHPTAPAPGQWQQDRDETSDDLRAIADRHPCPEPPRVERQPDPAPGDSPLAAIRAATDNAIGELRLAVAGLEDLPGDHLPILLTYRRALLDAERCGRNFNAEYNL